MGDFQDIFGAGADADDIIDGICRAESRYERERIRAEEIVEHLIWFPDYAAAEHWEKHHRGTPFTRQRRQGGYEVTVVGRRDEADELRRSAPGFPPAQENQPTTLLYAEGLGDREISHGGFRVRLAKRTSPILAAFQEKLRSDIPPGRAGLSPICLSLKQLRESCKGISEHISHELEMGQGIIALFCADHSFLAGRRVGKEVRIWPWVLEMDCGGGEPSEDGSKGCFLCNHNQENEVFSRSDYSRSDLWDSPQSHFIRYVTKGLRSALSLLQQ